LEKKHEESKEIPGVKKFETWQLKRYATVEKWLGVYRNDKGKTFILKIWFFMTTEGPYKSIL